MNQTSQLLVYKASAGSGKTFTLAVEYIKLLIQNPRAYQQILAVTFTNKATTEMKERILSQLYGIHTDDKESKPYLENVCAGLHMQAQEVQKAAGKALNYMLHDYSRFRVETIDSFFQSVMRNLSRELELSANLNIELNNAEVLSDAVDSMIEKLKPTSEVLAWLMDYINERIKDDKRWNVADEVKSFARNIFDEGYMEKGEGLRTKLKDKNCISNYRKELQEMNTDAVEQMKGFTDQFLGVLEANGLLPTDLKNGSRGIGSYFNKIQNEQFGNDIRNTTVEKCLESPDHWSTKTSPNKARILSLAASDLIPLLEACEKYRVTNNCIVNSCQLSLRHVNKVRLLANIDQEVRELNRENNRFLLSDTNALLHKLVREGDPSFVFEKIGSSIRNVMIDEFQDTSRMQWDNFKLLLLEGLSQGAGSLIVGDVKQSIYRWRNGDWRILNTLEGNMEAFPIEVRNLTTNRRSEANIIHFNNKLFTAAVTHLSTIYKTEMGKACESLLNAYKDVAQISPKNKERGYVKVSLLQPEEGVDYTEYTLQEMADEVENLLAQGVRLTDITILVRKNKSIPQIADYFDKHLPYKIVSDEAFRLDASLAVCMIIDGLRFLSNPNNLIARSQLIIAYQKEVLRQETELNTLLLDKEGNYFPHDFHLQIETLRLMPLYELAEKLFTLFEMTRIEAQDAYLFAFFDALTEYLQSNSSDIDSFIAYWDEKLCSKTIPSGEIEGIRITSIHKSKGLEFHTVLLPFCDWKMENETNNQLVWCAPKEEPFNQLDIVPVNYSTAMAQSIYCEDYENERLQLWVDNLNLLYVAFTRAECNLIVWGKAAQKGTVSELLFQSLIQLSNTVNSEWDQEEPYTFGALCPSESKEKKVTENKLTRQPIKLPIRMQSFTHKVEFKQSNRSADFIKDEEYNATQSGYIHQGTLLHTLFAGIDTVNDVETAIERLTFEGVINSKAQEQELRELTEEALSHPMVSEWYSGSHELFNECTIIYKENDVLQTRRPDRVMIKKDEVIVVDFKFGKRNKKYNKQVQNYMSLLARMGYSHITGYLWYVFEQDLEEVKSLKRNQ